jgi:hypothetical protein
LRGSTGGQVTSSGTALAPVVGGPV